MFNLFAESLPIASKGNLALNAMCYRSHLVCLPWYGISLPRATQSTRNDCASNYTSESHYSKCDSDSNTSLNLYILNTIIYILSSHGSIQTIPAPLAKWCLHCPPIEVAQAWGNPHWSHILLTMPCNQTKQFRVAIDGQIVVTGWTAFHAMVICPWAAHFSSVNLWGLFPPYRRWYKTHQGEKKTITEQEKHVYPS